MTSYHLHLVTGGGLACVVVVGLFVLLGGLRIDAEALYRGAPIPAPSNIWEMEGFVGGTSFLAPLW